MYKYARIMAKWGIIVSAFFVLTPKVYGLAESTGPGGSNSIAVHQVGDTGQGVNIGLMLGGNVRTTHEAFKDSNGISHAFNYDFSGDGIYIIAHDTQLAGIISSRGGAAYPSEIGIAPGADIYCARVSNDTGGISSDWMVNALDELITNHNCRIIVTGFELLGIDPNGDNPWSRLYDYYAYQYGVVFANPAGNEYTYVAIFGDAYNGITTGGLRLTNPSNSYDYRRVGLVSGSGPTSDGRRKPDITAPAEQQTVPTSSSDTAWTTVGSTSGQTSYSVPQLAGAAALMLQLADTTIEANDNYDLVIKAVLVNSAMPNVNDKAGTSTNPADPNNTWQADRGYGRLDCLRAYQTLNTDEVEPGTTIMQDDGWGYNQLAQTQSNTYTIHVTKRCRLIATISWHRRIEWVDKKSGFPPRGDDIVQLDELTGYLANLDMTVYSPYQPEPIFNKAMFGYDSSDNLIKCDLPVLEPGDYTIVIANNSASNETANYGFAFELHPIMTADLPPPIDYVVNNNDLSILASQWLSNSLSIDSLLAPNGIIDFGDFAVLANEWLQFDGCYFQY